MVNSLQLYKKMQRIVDKKIMPALGQKAVLRRTDGDFPCRVALVQFTPVERMGGLVDPLAVKAVVSNLNLAITPEQGKDNLVIFNPVTKAEAASYRIVQRPANINPGGLTIVWQLQVRLN
jgi:hypothetical protein